MKYILSVLLFLCVISGNSQTLGDDFLKDSLNYPEEIDYLFLEDRNLTELPDSFEKLTNLKSLYLFKNQLDSLPASVFSIKTLKTLDLSSNKFTKISNNIQNLENLELLYLNDNQLETFDESICKLVNLEFLDIENNSIKTIPNCIANLTNLKTLVIGGNSFENFPTIILKLNNLEVLKYNDLKSNLPNLTSLTKLKEIYIDKNYYKSNKSIIKKLLPKGCKVNPIIKIPPPPVEIIDIPVNSDYLENSIEDKKHCFVNITKVESKDKVETQEQLLEFGWNNDLARIVVSKTELNGENIKERIEEAKKKGWELVGKTIIEFFDGTFLIKDKVLTFTSDDLKMSKNFKIFYKNKSKEIDKLQDTVTNEYFNVGPCLEPMISIGN